MSIFFEKIKSQESHLIMPQLAKKRPPNGTSLFVIARHKSAISTYKNKLPAPTLSPNIAILTFDIKAK